MASTPSNSTSAGTRAITIPLHSSIASSRSAPGHHSGRRGVSQADSDGGNASSSSLGSDWTSSPVSPAQSVNPSRAGLPASSAYPATASQTSLGSSRHRQRKDKQRADSDNLPPNSLPPLFPPAASPLGPSMISSSAYKSVNLNSHYDPESKEPARLITYTKYSQGFTWNDELFLPSYLLGKHRYRGHGSSAGRRRWSGDDDDDHMADFEEEGERCPVTDIFVTDEEAAAMMP